MPTILCRTLSLAALCLCLTAWLLPAETLRLVNAQRTSSSADLPYVINHLEQADQPAWIAWSVPTRDGVSLGPSDDSVVFLEHEVGWGHAYNQSSRPHDVRAILLLRVAAHTLTELRVESPTRTLDAGNLPVVELTSITPEQSLTALKRLATAPETIHLRDSLVFAISLHGASSTIPTLTSLTTAANPSDLREKACFWLGSSPDPAAFAALQHLARTDPDSGLREKLTFDLTLAKQSGATNELIRMAHTDPAINVRKQAQFWMARLGGERILADLRSSASTDPNTEVRKSAVFALSQLPADQATPQLIHVAQSNDNPEARKQAIFWLGQSSDPEALDFLTRFLEQ